MESLELPGFFVSTEWVQERLGQPGLRIIQAGGESYYEQAHLPGAVLLRYADILTSRDGVPGMRADCEHLAQVFGMLGLDSSTTVVVYDAAGGTDASRVVWTLTTMNHQRAAVLDGGLSQWMQERRPFEHEIHPVEPVLFLPECMDNSLSSLIDWQGVLRVVRGEEEAILIDTRTENEYLGMNMTGPRGHIPGALHMDWMENLRGRTNPLLKPDVELELMYNNLGLLDRDQPVITYCQTAHRAAQTWLVLRHLGFSQVKLYDGSIAEWGLRQLPFSMGPAPRGV
jgi:thiosulfate/3-mercaptopyruvate sulfurtransferase